MNEDPIVAEVRRERDKLARRFNYDIHAIFSDLAAREREQGARHPLAQNAEEWALAHSAESALALKEKAANAGGA